MIESLWYGVAVGKTGLTLWQCVEPKSQVRALGLEGGLDEEDQGSPRVAKSLRV